MARPYVAIILGLLLLAPQASGAAVRVQDPARDIMLTGQGLSVPVDSIDIVSFELTEAPGSRAATMRVADLSRRGTEDALFVQAEHSQRVYLLTQMYEGNSALLLIALQYDDEPTLRVAALHVQPPNVVQLPATGVLDAASNNIQWSVETPDELGEPLDTFAVTVLLGCASMDECQSPMRGFAAMDVAPNSIAHPLAVVSPELWWDDVA